MDRRFIFLTAILGFTGVALGAFGAHALKNAVAGLVDGPQRLAWWETGARYHLSHALAVGLVGLVSTKTSSRWSGWATASFTSGIVLFSGSLYVMAFTGLRVLGAITPLGGLCFLGGWVLFALTASKQKEAPRLEGP
jgi:uncharacterized membrane protein YgdD (TMEM256/DUF423 family)